MEMNVPRFVKREGEGDNTEGSDEKSNEKECSDELQCEDWSEKSKIKDEGMKINNTFTAAASKLKQAANLDDDARWEVVMGFLAEVKEEEDKVCCIKNAIGEAHKDGKKPANGCRALAKRIPCLKAAVADKTICTKLGEQKVKLWQNFKEDFQCFYKLVRKFANHVNSQEFMEEEVKIDAGEFIRDGFGMIKALTIIKNSKDNCSKAKDAVNTKERALVDGLKKLLNKLQN